MAQRIKGRTALYFPVGRSRGNVSSWLQRFFPVHPRTRTVAERYCDDNRDDGLSLAKACRTCQRQREAAETSCDVADKIAAVGP